jgi:hypothetical protein
VNALVELSTSDRFVVTNEIKQFGVLRRNEQLFLVNHVRSRKTVSNNFFCNKLICGHILYYQIVVYVIAGRSSYGIPFHF